MSNPTILPILPRKTLIPIRAVVDSLETGQRDVLISQKMAHWRERKLLECQVVVVALCSSQWIQFHRCQLIITVAMVVQVLTESQSTLLSAAIIGCFSWTPKENEHWLGPAAWYSALVMSLFAILRSLFQAFIFSTIKRALGRRSSAKELLMIARVRQITDPVAGNNGGKGDGDLNKQPRRQVKIRWNMVFT